MSGTGSRGVAENAEKLKSMCALVLNSISHNPRFALLVPLPHPGLLPKEKERSRGKANAMDLRPHSPPVTPVPCIP